jgi:pSer/pThr/pTyr-binding forkhead associated (FHA) protein
MRARRTIFARRLDQALQLLAVSSPETIGPLHKEWNTRRCTPIVHLPTRSSNASLANATRGTRLMRARIQILGGSQGGQTIEVDQAMLLIGREEDCHLRPNGEFVSRHHCALLLDDHTFRIRDLGSKNGTFVNGARIRTGDTILWHDDLVSIGELTFLIDLSQSPNPKGRPAPPSTAMEGTGVHEGDTQQADVQPLPRSHPTPQQEKQTESRPSRGID